MTQAAADPDSTRRMYPAARLKRGREKSVLARHPWVFSGALQEPPADAGPGDPVIVESHRGEPLGVGAWSPASQIAVRIWSFDPAAIIDENWFRGRLEAALARRGAFASGGAARLVNAESDGLPGLIVDRYDDHLVCQFLSAGAERWREALTGALAVLCSPAGIYERSDTDGRTKEGLAPRTGVLSGAEPPDRIEVQWAGMKLQVDVRNGHKTGLYLDQRDNLALIRARGAHREVLNCYAYTGAFSIAALQGGARSVLNVESSEPVLAALEANHAINDLDPGRMSAVAADVPTQLRRLRDAGAQFDMVLLDPPRFVANAAQIDRGSRAYKDINLLGIKLLRPGGLLITFSCSGHVSPELFQKIVADAALDARRDVRIIGLLHQAPDHPVLTSFPQGRYLKGLICTAD